MLPSIRIKKRVKSATPNSVLFRLGPFSVGKYARLMTWYRYGRHHHAPIDPMDLIMVDPTKIDYKLINKEGFFSESDIISEIIDGKWDCHIQKLDEYDLYRAIVRRIRSGIPWEETDFYARVNNRYETRDYDKWGCETFGEFQDRLDELDELHNTIAREGYKTQRELRQAGKPAPATREIHYYWPPELHEVTINIGRNGELIFHEGRHRFAIASALELDKIPVRVNVRHSEWQERRDRIAQGRVVNSKFTNHPDLKIK